MSLAGSHVTSGRGLTFLPPTNIYPISKTKGTLPVHTGGVPTAARVNPSSTDPHKIPYFREPREPLPPFRSSEHLFSSAIASQSQPLFVCTLGFPLPLGAWGSILYPPHSRGEIPLGYLGFPKPANQLNRKPIKFDKRHPPCECPACPPALALPQTNNHFRPRSTSCVTAKRNNRSNWITHMLSLKLRLKSFIGAVSSVVQAWYWEDSIMMEWESGIVILAE